LKQLTTHKWFNKTNWSNLKEFPGNYIPNNMDELENCIYNFTTLENDNTTNSSDKNYENNRQILIDKLTNNFDEFTNESKENDNKCRYIRRRDIDDKFIGYSFKGNKDQLQINDEYNE
jgi:hypothetical protein